MSDRSFDEDVTYWLGLDTDGNETEATDDVMLGHLTDQEIWGLGDSYDDGRIDTLTSAYTRLRAKYYQGPEV